MQHELEIVHPRELHGANLFCLVKVLDHRPLADPRAHPQLFVLATNGLWYRQRTLVSNKSGRIWSAVAKLGWDETSSAGCLYSIVVTTQVPRMKPHATLREIPPATQQGGTMKGTSNVVTLVRALFDD